jgi:disulfide bond formation protein DsbB
MRWFKNYSLYFAWVIALAGVLVSLYYGEVLRMEPCRLCWYQRVGMFPLALFLGIATYKDEPKLAFYTLPLVIFGGLFALYQSLTQLFPYLKMSALCSESAPCTFSGSIPYLSFLAFVSIAVLILFRNCTK